MGRTLSNASIAINHTNSFTIMFIHAVPVLDQLLAGRIIEQVAHEAATQKFDALALPEEPFHTLGAGLVWLLDNEIVPSEVLDQLESLLESEHAQEDVLAINAIRKQAVAEFAALISAQQHASFERQFWANVFRGPRWAWQVGGVAAVVFVGWFFLAPDATPPCANKRVESALRSGLIQVVFGDSGKPWLGNMEDRSKLLLAEFTDFKEIGYIKKERMRGCSVTLTIEDASVPVAFTVGPEAGSRELMVRGGDRRVIEAKYGRANKDGTVPEFGAPLGKSHLSFAFSRGVEAFEKKTAPVNATALKEMNRRLGIDTDKKTVQSVEPLADCVAVEPNKKYACRLQIQYIDRVMAVLGRSDMQVVEGDFDFVKQEDGWVVSDDFPRQYMDAMVRGRLGAVKGEEAAKMLEDIQKNRGKEAASADE